MVAAAQTLALDTPTALMGLLQSDALCGSSRGWLLRYYDEAPQHCLNETLDVHCVCTA